MSLTQDVPLRYCGEEGQVRLFGVVSSVVLHASFGNL